MKFSAKFTTFSFIAAAVAAGAFAFGCTVTSGTVDEDGGPTVTPSSDSGTDGTTAATCEGNKQTGTLVSADCQACLNAKCCTELKTCFNATAAAGPQGGTNDCSATAECVSKCYTDTTTADEEAKCINDDCYGALAAAGIADAYKGILSCGASNGCKDVCGIGDSPQADAGDQDAADAADQ